MFYSLLLETKKNELKVNRAAEDMLFLERDLRRSETRTNGLHPFFHPNPPPQVLKTVLSDTGTVSLI